MARGKREKRGSGNGTAANVGYEAQLWQMADALRGSMDAAEYKHVVLGLIFLKYIFFVALETMHERIAAGASKWAKELEGSYIPKRALRLDRRPGPHPYIDRGSTLDMVHPESGYWVIHRHILREHGVVLVGPPPRTLIDPLHPAELREAVRGILREWWMPMLREGPLLQNPFYRCYAVLTMCRMLYTMRHGAIVSKPVAARWAQEALDARWTPLIRDALAWSREVAPDLDLTLAYIRRTCEYGGETSR